MAPAYIPRDVRPLSLHRAGVAPRDSQLRPSSGEEDFEFVVVVVVYTETLARGIRPTDSDAPTRETYLLWQVPQTVLWRAPSTR